MSIKVVFVTMLVLCFSNTKHAVAMSAGGWLDACMLTLVVKKEEWSKLAPKTLLAIRECEKTAADVWCREGFDGTSVKPAGITPQKLTEATKAVNDVCPVPLEYPWGGLHFIALKYWEGKGGLSLLHRWYSARSIVLQAYKDRWPRCQATRLKYDAQTKPNEMQGCIESWLKVARD